MKQSMLFLLCWLFSAAVGATDVPAGDVSGTWTAAGSPYLIQGDIRVAPDTELILEPGTQVRFTGTYSLRILGDFQALGTEADSVRFESETESTWWNGIQLDSLHVNSDTARFEYCVIRRMRNTGMSVISTSKVVVSRSRIGENDQLYIGSVYTALGDPKFDRVYFHDNTSASGSEGAAMYIWDASPIIRQCIFERNHSPWSAGAVTTYRSDVPTEPVFDRCVFRNNTTWGSGGAVVLHSNTPSQFIQCRFEGNNAGTNGGAIWDGYTQANVHQFVRCTFTGNWCEDHGGAVYSVDSRSRYEDCDFQGNYTQFGRGGAISADDDSMDLELDEVRFTSNSAGGQGGALYMTTEGVLRINRCLFAGNSGTQGGAIYASYYVDAELVNSVFANNSSSSWGGALYLVQFMDPVISGCVFAHNQAGGKGGAMGLYWAVNPQVSNTILWNNQSEDGLSTYAVNEYIWNYCVPNFDHCVVDGGEATFVYDTSGPAGYTNNLEADPLFAAPSSAVGAEAYNTLDQWSVLADSPCIDAGGGDLDVLPLGELDYLGQARVQGASIDIGAYEGPYPAFNSAIDFNGDGVVDALDLLELLGGFGCNGPGCLPDINGDGNTGAQDILTFLGLYF